MSMKNKVFAPCYLEIKFSPKVIKSLEKLRDGNEVNISRFTSKELNGIGLCYWYGHIVPLNYKEAVKWYIKSANKRCAKAEFNLYVCYNKGTGVAHDIDKAMYWLKKAAKHNDAGAQDILGTHYFLGTNIKRNRRYAKIWFKKSLENALKNENAVTLNVLGVRYYRGGYGFPIDKEMAIKCFTPAAKKRYPLSIFWLMQIYIEDNNEEMVKYLMKEYKKCVRTEPKITFIINRMYYGFTNRNNN